MIKKYNLFRLVSQWYIFILSEMITDPLLFAEKPNCNYTVITPENTIIEDLFEMEALTWWKLSACTGGTAGATDFPLWRHCHAKCSHCLPGSVICYLITIDHHLLWAAIQRQMVGTSSRSVQINNLPKTRESCRNKSCPRRQFEHQTHWWNATRTTHLKVKLYSKWVKNTIDCVLWS